MRLIDADALKVDMEEKVFCGDGTYKVFGYSTNQIKNAPTISLPDTYLTQEEMQKMDGIAVWCDDYKCDGIISVDKYGMWANVPFLVCRIDGVNCTYNIADRKLTIYRHKPKGASQE